MIERPLCVLSSQIRAKYNMFNKYLYRWKEQVETAKIYNTARKQEYPEGTQADSGRTCQQVHTEKTPAQPEVEPRALLAVTFVPNVFSLRTHSCSQALHNFFLRRCIISDKISGNFEWKYRVSPSFPLH